MTLESETEEAKDRFLASGVLAFISQGEKEDGEGGRIAHSLASAEVFSWGEKRLVGWGGGGEKEQNSIPKGGWSLSQG